MPSQKQEHFYSYTNHAGSDPSEPDPLRSSWSPKARLDGWKLGASAILAAAVLAALGAAGLFPSIPRAPLARSSQARPEGSSLPFPTFFQATGLDSVTVQYGSRTRGLSLNSPVALDDVQAALLINRWIEEESPAWGPPPRITRPMIASLLKELASDSPVSDPSLCTSRTVVLKGGGREVKAEVPLASFHVSKDSCEEAAVLCRHVKRVRILRIGEALRSFAPSPDA